MALNTVTSQYYQIAETIKNRIQFGNYKIDQIIPAEKDLAKEFGVSDITIRKALDILVQEKWIKRKRGVGTKIIKKLNERVPIKITGDFQDWFDSASGKFPKHLDVKILSIELKDCSEDIRKILDIPNPNPVWQMRRIRAFKKEPFSFYINYAQPKLFSKIRRNTFKKKTVFEIMQDDCSISINRIDQKVEAITAGLDLSNILKINFGDPLFFCENIYFCRDKAIEYTQMFYRGDRYIYQGTIHR